MKIGNHEVGPGHPVFIVAELSGNHNGSLANALELVRCAYRAGADAVKTQCFTPDSMTLDCDAEPFRIVWQEQERTLYDLYSETALPMDWHRPLKELANDLGMEYFASVFSPKDADFMEALGVPAYKIASFELTDLSLIRHVARKGKPVILSTGMGSRDEIEQACDAIRSYGVPFGVLLCSSVYPSVTLPLHRLGHGWFSFTDLSIPGISDHTLSTILPAVAIARDCRIVEKHLCLSRANEGPDSSFSLEPEEFAAMVKAVRDAEKCLGEVPYRLTEAEISMLRYRRSWFVARDIQEGEEFTADNVRCIRPADGLPPDTKVLGKYASQSIPKGTPLWETMLR